MIQNLDYVMIEIEDRKKTKKREIESKYNYLCNPSGNQMKCNEVEIVNKMRINKRHCNEITDI